MMLISGKLPTILPNCWHFNIYLHDKNFAHSTSGPVQFTNTCNNGLKACFKDKHFEMHLIVVICPYTRGKRTKKATCPEVIKLFSYSIQLSTKFILLINAKMPTIVGILTFISMINTTSERLKAWDFFNCRYFSFYEQLKFRAQLR